MIRKLSAAAVVALILVAPVEAKRAIRPLTPTDKLVHADVVVIGKISAIEKDFVTAKPTPEAPDKLSYKVAVIKVETGLVGAANVTHIKVAFIPPAPVAPDAPVRPIRGFQPVILTEGTEGLFYLTKHHSGDFYTINPMLAPTDTKAEDYKAQVEQVKKGAGVLAEPMKALKSDKAADRFFAANVLVNKYRVYPQNGGEVENVKVAADESKLVLKAIAEGNWKPDPNAVNAPNPFQTFSQLGLTEKDGWKYPVVKPGDDFIDKTKEAFVAWLAGPGKDYQINKFVPKKK